MGLYEMESEVWEMKSETVIQNEIRCALSEYGIVIRMNSGVFQTEDGRHVRNGVTGLPDLLFIGCNGKTAWIEVKTDKGRIRPEQARFIEMLQKYGHDAGIARSTSDALRIIGVST